MTKSKGIGRRSSLISEMDALLGYGYDIGDVMRAAGTSYDAALKVLRRAQRDDLVEQLKQWREEERDRVRHALGRART